jgi:hypothetical protein
MLNFRHKAKIDISVALTFEQAVQILVILGQGSGLLDLSTCQFVAVMAATTRLR